MRDNNVPEQTYKLSIKQIPSHLLLQTTQLLGLPILELNDRIKLELEENPLLEVEDENTLSLISTEYSKVDTDKVDEIDRDLGEVSDTYDVAKIKEIELYERKVRGGYTQTIEGTLSERETLQEHLLFQAKLDISDERLFTLATYIVYELDDNGFFKGSIENLRNVEGYSFQDSEIEEIRERIKRYDPVGCGSKTLEEALVTQLEVYYPNLPKLDVYRRIIEEDLKLLATEGDRVRQKYNLSREEFENLRSILRFLSPKPGANFSVSPSIVVPEAIVRKVDENTLEVEYNDSYVPTLRIRKEYVSAIRKVDSPELKSKLNRARSLILAVEYRKKTLRAIIDKIVQHQRDFLLGKQNFLNSFLLEDLASEMETTVSTISRAIRDKFILTPLGLLPLKYFFVRSGKGIGGEDVSVDRIKKLIKELVDGEGVKPLSDEKIALILSNKGVRISRRTVTKYRKAMGIPPAHKRKNEKNIHSSYTDR
ncbi:MAG: RNA polymerase factor sigma-54 [Brevinematia bacterium]